MKTATKNGASMPVMDFPKREMDREKRRKKKKESDGGNHVV